MVKRDPRSTRSATDEEGKKYRNFPKHSLESTLVLPQKIQDELGGQPMKRLLLTLQHAVRVWQLAVGLFQHAGRGSHHAATGLLLAVTGSQRSVVQRLR